MLRELKVTLKVVSYLYNDTCVILDADPSHDLCYRDAEFRKMIEVENLKLRRLIIGTEALPYVDIECCRAIQPLAEFIKDFYPVFTFYDTYFKSVSIIISVMEPIKTSTIDVAFSTDPNIIRNRRFVY